MRMLVRVLACAAAAACGDGPSQPDPNTGRLTVVITGLPAGTDAAVQVDGPGNYQQLVPDTRTFAQLVPGAYTVMASPVNAGGTGYTPLPATQTLTVATNDRDTATVAYAP